MVQRKHVALIRRRRWFDSTLSDFSSFFGDKKSDASSPQETQPRPIAGSWCNGSTADF